MRTLALVLMITLSTPAMAQTTIVTTSQDPKEAIKELTKLIQQTPTDGTCDQYLATLYKCRGIEWSKKLKNYYVTAQAKTVTKLGADLANMLTPSLATNTNARVADLHASTQFGNIFANEDLPVGNEVKDFTESLRLNPQQADVYILRGRSYLQNMKVTAKNEEPDIVSAYYEHAIEDFGRALRIDEKSAYAYYWRGKTRLERWNMLWRRTKEKFDDDVKAASYASQKQKTDQAAKLAKDLNDANATKTKADDALSAALAEQKNAKLPTDPAAKVKVDAAQKDVDAARSAVDTAKKALASANNGQNQKAPDPATAAQKDVDAAQIVYNQANQDYGKALDFWTKAYANLAAVNKDPLGNVTKVNIVAVNVNNLAMSNKELFAYAAKVFDRADQALIAKENAWNDARDKLAAYNRVLAQANDKKKTDDANSSGPSDLDVAKRPFDVASIDLRDSLADFTSALRYQPCDECEISKDSTAASDLLKVAREYLAEYNALTTKTDVNFKAIPEQTTNIGGELRIIVKVTEMMSANMTLTATVEGNEKITGNGKIEKGENCGELTIKTSGSKTGVFVVKVNAAAGMTTANTTFKLKISPMFKAISNQKVKIGQELKVTVKLTDDAPIDMALTAKGKDAMGKDNDKITGIGKIAKDDFKGDITVKIGDTPPGDYIVEVTATVDIGTVSTTFKLKIEK